MNYFFNISNTPSFQWSPEQIAAAEKFGKIIDIPFPELSSKAGPKEIEYFADNFALYRVLPILFGRIVDPILEIFDDQSDEMDLSAVALIEGEENLAEALIEAIKIYSDGKIRCIKKEELIGCGQIGCGQLEEFKITDQDGLYRYYKEHWLNAFLYAIQVAEAFEDAFENNERQADTPGQAMCLLAQSLKDYLVDQVMRRK